MKRLVSFDFDKTLFHTPEPEFGREIFLEKTGREWPHRGWWGKPETLDMEIFEIPLNEWVFDFFQNHSNNENDFVILATGRLNKVSGMRENVNNILERNGIKFDEVHLNWGSDTLKFKMKLFEQKIHELGVDEFIMFDDRSEHLIEFEEWAKNLKTKTTIVDVINKTQKIIL